MQFRCIISVGYQFSCGPCGLGMSVRLYERFDAGEMAKDLEAGKGTIVSSLVAKMLMDFAALGAQTRL